jgi:hypothetical protein
MPRPSRWSMEKRGFTCINPERKRFQLCKGPLSLDVLGKFVDMVKYEEVTKLALFMFVGGYL